MKFDMRYANHPEDSKYYDTIKLRKRDHISNLFGKGSISVGGDGIPTAELRQ